MIDHLLGRPDPRFRKYQIFTVVFLWSLYLYKGNKHGPPVLRDISTFFSKRITPWQTMVMTLLYLYITRNWARVVGLVSPEPLANMYTRDYFRATWVTTALDAGFWTCMNLRPIWFRDLASIVSTAYYLICAEQADEVRRKVLGCINVDFMRVSWNKPRSPYIALLGNIMRPRFMRSPPRRIVIQRPPWSEYTEPISAWLYFDGPLENLKRHDKLILDIPGGGFVAMDPRCHDDKLIEWAGKSGLPVVALNYRKAPEYAFPYALNECFDAYCELVRTRGCCVGMSGDVPPKIVLSGDSAGGNLAAATVLMVLQSSPNTLYEANYRNDRLAIPVPEGLVMTYPALDMNMSNWMTPQQVALLKQKRKTNKGILDRKNEDYRKLQPRTPHGSDLFDHDSDSSSSPPPLRRNTTSSKLLDRSPSQTSLSGLDEIKEESLGEGGQKANGKVDSTPQEALAKTQRPFKTSLAMSSIISYFHDRVLPPESMRAMLLLYVGERNQPDFATDFLLSPLLAPDSLLSRFPKVYMLTGERDPLSDDTVLFAGRLRQAHEQRFLQRQEMGLEPHDKIFDSTKHVEYVLISGISHGFLQFANIYPPAWKYIEQARRWMMEIFREADERPRQNESATPFPTNGETLEFSGSTMKRSRYSRNASENALSVDEPSDPPLEMKPRHRRTSSGPSLSRPRNGERMGRGSIAKPTQVYHSGRRSPTATRNALSRLSSSENLIDRRMNGLTVNLIGDGTSSELL